TASLLLALFLNKNADAYVQWAVFQLGQFLRMELAEDATGAARRLFEYFPTVVWFDAMRTLVLDPGGDFPGFMLRSAVWIVLPLLTLAVSLKHALSPHVRMCWHADGGGPQPADAVAAPIRRFDPDGVSGPIEAWMLLRF